MKRVNRIPLICAFLLLCSGAAELFFKYIFYRSVPFGIYGYNIVCFSVTLIAGAAFGMLFLCPDGRAERNREVRPLRLILFLLFLAASFSCIFLLAFNSYFHNRNAYPHGYDHFVSDFSFFGVCNPENLTNHLIYLLTGVLLVSVLFKMRTEKPDDTAPFGRLRRMAPAIALILMVPAADFLSNRLTDYLMHILNGGGITEYYLYLAAIFLINVVFGGLFGLLFARCHKGKQDGTNPRPRKYYLWSLPALTLGALPFAAVTVSFQTHLVNNLFYTEITDPWSIGWFWFDDTVYANGLLRFFTYSDFLQNAQMLFGLLLTAGVCRTVAKRGARGTAA